MGTVSTREEVAANNLKSRSVRITAIYSDYTPPFKVEPIIRRMLDSIPERYLVGLSEVVLTNATGLSRARRRSVTKSRKRKIRQASALGLYHQAWKGKEAWIEIFVDNILEYWTGKWLFAFRLMREKLIGDVLFHEVGHHIHYTAKPEFREKEDVADDWKEKLRTHYYCTKRPILRAFLRSMRPLIRWYVTKSEPLPKQRNSTGQVGR